MRESAKESIELDGRPEQPAGLRRMADELLPLFYTEVRRQAVRERARVGAGATLQTTALVHEAYLKLRGSAGFVDPAHFLRAAALAMRHALINHAHERLTAKRGGGAVHVTLGHADTITVDTDEGLVALDEALQRLDRQQPRLASVVECRFFAGYGIDETATALGLSVRTVHRDWLVARAWLFRELGGSA